MNSADKLMDMLCTELDEIADKGQLSAGDLDTVQKLVLTKEKLLRIEEIEGKLGYSNAGDWTANGSYGGNSYKGGQHYVRGHYSRSNGRMYSMADGKAMIVEEIREMMNDQNMTGRDREALERAMRELNR